MDINIVLDNMMILPDFRFDQPVRCYFRCRRAAENLHLRRSCSSPHPRRLRRWWMRPRLVSLSAPSERRAAPLPSTAAAACRAGAERSGRTQLLAGSASRRKAESDAFGRDAGHPKVHPRREDSRSHIPSATYATIVRW